MLQRSPIKQATLAEIHDEFRTALNDLVSDLQDARSEDRADLWDKVKRLSAKTHALHDRLLGAMCEEAGEHTDYAGCFADLAEVADRRADAIRDGASVYSLNDEHRIGCFEAGVGRYGSWGR